MKQSSTKHFTESDTHTIMSNTYSNSQLKYNDKNYYHDLNNIMRDIALKNK